MKTGYMTDFGKGEMDWLTERMASIGVVDIGRIIGFKNSTFRADVELYNIVGSQQQVLSDVELLVPGNDSNGIFSSPVGSSCLVLYPRAPLKSTRTEEVMYTRKKFDSSGVKCIPLSTLKRTPVRVGFDPMGNFSIANPTYAIQFDEHGLQLTLGENNEIRITCTSDSITLKNKNTSSVYKNDGSASVSIVNPVTGESICSIDKGNDGAISIITNGNVDLVSKGSVTLKADGGSTLEGDITINGSLTVSGDFSAADGNFTASSGS